MRVLVYSIHGFERPFLEAAAANAKHHIDYLPTRLMAETAPLAAGYDAVCAFANDRLDEPALNALVAAGVRLVALRSAGFNQVDLPAAERLGLTVMRVPAYSPHSVAEHTVALMLALNRKIHKAYNRVREGNFALDGLVGFDMRGRTVGIIGAGKIGTAAARILLGFGCRVIVSDPKPCDACRELELPIVEANTLFAESDIVSLHCPLTPATHHLVNEAALARMKPGAMLINTSRGAVVETRAIIGALKSGRLGALGLDVYEEEADLFFHDLSGIVIQDDVFARLLTFPNVLITAHQAFLTRDALRAIAETTIANLDGFEQGVPATENIVNASMIAPVGGTAR